MDIRQVGSAIPPTSALDGLSRIHGSSATDDSEDSQSSGYLFGDSGKGRGQQHADDETAESPIDSVELSAEAIAAAIAATAASDSVILSSSPSEGGGGARQLDDDDPILGSAAADSFRARPVGIGSARRESAAPERHLDIQA